MTRVFLFDLAKKTLEAVLGEGQRGKGQGQGWFAAQFVKCASLARGLGFLGVVHLVVGFNDEQPSRGC